MPIAANVGPNEVHTSIRGGATLLQMELLGNEHDPRCLHYEWGPCTCAKWRSSTQVEVVRSSWKVTVTVIAMIFIIAEAIRRFERLCGLAAPAAV